VGLVLKGQQGVLLSEEQSKELSSIAQSRSLPAGYVFRARLILMLAEGATFSMIQKQLRTTAATILRWKTRFLRLGMEWIPGCNYRAEKRKFPANRRTGFIIRDQ
jgi:hypothetical protein